jgi:hypothetical protein
MKSVLEYWQKYLPSKMIRFRRIFAVVFISGVIFNQTFTQPVQLHETLEIQPEQLNQQVHIKMIDMNQVIQDTLVNLQEFVLPENNNLAVIKWGDQVTKLPESYHVPGMQQHPGKNYMMPYRFLAKLKDNTTVYLDVLLINNRPLEFDDSKLEFHGSLVFRLVNRNDPAQSGKELKETVLFELFSRELGILNPSKIELSRTNTDSPEIHCYGKSGLTDSADVKIVTEFKPEGYVFYLNVEPYLEIKCSRKSIQGLGIQEVSATLMLLGSSQDVSINASLDVSLGSVKPEIIAVAASSPSVFKVRSENIGEATLNAHSPNIRTIPVTIRFVFPWLFLLFGLGGGILGALARNYLKDKVNILTSKAILFGMLYGFIGTVAWYGLGVNLLSFELPTIANEMGVLGVSALISLTLTPS